ncbi:MAG TPA: cytochrome c [Candidatus Binatia bacterium]|nr:cytochrome c [Candidatus Binatia bacterium]
MVRDKFLIAAVVALMTLFVSSHVFAQADVIEQRQKLMKSNSANAKAIKAAVEKKDYATIETKAKDIMGNADKIVGLFPKGSTKGKTKAEAAIWEKPDEFAKDAKALAKAAGELAAAAKAKDDAAIEVKVKALSGTCGGCHKPFRAKDYSE